VLRWHSVGQDRRKCLIPPGISMPAGHTGPACVCDASFKAVVLHKQCVCMYVLCFTMLVHHPTICKHVPNQIAQNLAQQLERPKLCQLSAPVTLGFAQTGHGRGHCRLHYPTHPRSLSTWVRCCGCGFHPLLRLPMQHRGWEGVEGSGGGR
jgi:hypothetical protein